MRMAQAEVPRAEGAGQEDEARRRRPRPAEEEDDEHEADARAPRARDRLERRQRRQPAVRASEPDARCIWGGNPMMLQATTFDLRYLIVEPGPWNVTLRLRPTA
eukprot:3119265-Pyramimonas_sp.AAC.1